MVLRVLLPEAVLVLIHTTGLLPEEMDPLLAVLMPGTIQ